MPGAGGLEALGQINQRPDAEVVITGYGTVQSAVQAMKNGAYDYVTKPFSFEELAAAGAGRGPPEAQKREPDAARTGEVEAGLRKLVGRAPEMEKLYRIIAKAAHSTHPVLILGESGTGKELVARSIHYSGPLRDKPFIPVDCGSLVPTLIESELFGYVRARSPARYEQGRIAGHRRRRHGLSGRSGRAARRPAGQAAAAIQEKEIRPVGGTRRIPINVRILAATNRDLEQAVAGGTFRRDLYFRLNVLTLRIPPLRERRQDIPLLVGHFLEKQSRAAGQQRTISDEALRAMLAYDWPGNVRELENCLERGCAFSSGPVLSVETCPPSFTAPPAPDFRTAISRESFPWQNWRNRRF